MRIALFGTSADPPTAGHQAILSWLSERYDWVAVWAADNPFKSHQTALIHRAAMLQLLIAGIQTSRHNIALEQELSSFRTLETLEKAKMRWGEDPEYTLVIGSDLLNQLPRWYKVEDLLRQVQLLVVPRPGYAIDESSFGEVQKLGGKIAIASLTGLDISSTAYREHGDSQALTPPIVAYINREHLYKCQDATTKSFQLR
ncbi:MULTISPECIES: nicotinate-nucleotide adenylyltransferase [unclassified Tolypothrix]|uniref:nicotinate-nucleotide adenylyltransferase n=1 Tax=unclassified Tolypothrix TaxID=2649714 RepID=UPI0005EAAEBE|nr:MULTISPECIES: nicotinate-nucleotide adenylyltransferase [unclassified Tolypothrix]BAY90875.1 nicotinate-nucleotide adenylyltransferase [Microchaete diplosiphon NIES-3275]EKE96597.1 nicotinate nucleotide adenylyltransferase [Tolypothrix sp. PCC 7601]MBE9082050.1 nicotinate-nucleotide adenylyltransferase [Tolypothrix sp. LEGE 11397]UYD24999.1 nicotinate-nucleotide adenylyltransferase [Tolypothrix sp. PCC 7712]UYD32765.1 nicotinate-nucleotide adenylyltransferase [Tolypothrix sp. PCC 7601]